MSVVHNADVWLCLLVIVSLSFAEEIEVSSFHRRFQRDLDFDAEWEKIINDPSTMQFTDINRETFNPVTEVYYRNVTNKKGQDVDVPVAIAANCSLLNNRINFNSTLMNRYRNLLDPEPDDEAGHLVASVFFGPPEWYNLVPQHKTVNRNSGGTSISIDWFNTEAEIRTFLKANEKYNPAVIWKAIVRYNHESSRPTAFTFRPEFFINELVPKVGFLRNRAPSAGLR